MNKTIVSIIVVAVFAGGAFMLMRDTSEPQTVVVQNNVSTVNGQQVIKITAKGGYTPRQTIAKANIPTTLKVLTNGTYDCSTVFTIPSMRYRSFLPATGETTIPLPAQPAGSVLKGTCGMGMYNFEISFK